MNLQTITKDPKKMYKQAILHLMICGVFYSTLILWGIFGDDPIGTAILTIFILAPLYAIVSGIIFGRKKNPLCWSLSVAQSVYMSLFMIAVFGYMDHTTVVIPGISCLGIAVGTNLKKRSPKERLT